MAVAELIVSRREVLAAACAAPLSRHPGAGRGPDQGSKGNWIPDRARNDERGDEQSPTVTKWDRALARFRGAEAALAAGAGADDELFDRLLDRLNRALGRLLRVPAPNLPALATKLDLLVAHQVWELRYTEPAMAALKQDAHRLARRAN
jgi:hypothetical protein